MALNRFAKDLLQRLEHLHPYVYYAAASGSFYLKFKTEKMGSIRIADHPGKAKYHYRWNLRADIDGAYSIENQFFFPVQMVEELAQAIELWAAYNN